MSSSMLLGVFDWIGDFFKALFDLIPKVMYLLYASFACILDVLQLFFRKLAGLDVYYVDGEAVGGDLITNFITGILGINNKDSISYSALSTVFWSMIVFGIIMCFGCTIFAIIRSHYTYEKEAKNGPMQYVYTAGKAILNMVVVPIMVVLGLYVSEAILNALDTITSTTSGNIAEMFGDAADQFESVPTAKAASGAGGNSEETYIYYDIFGFAAHINYGNYTPEEIGGWDWVINSKNLEGKKERALVGAKSQPFSGSLFKVAAYNANRARLGTMSVVKGGAYGEFTGNPGSITSGTGGTFFEEAYKKHDDKLLADMIDTLFANNIHLKDPVGLNYGFSPICSFKYFTNFLTTYVPSFSKFNVGLVWYYYDLWQFNFIVGFAGCIVCLSIFINIILGLITRLFMCIVLFLVAPPLFGLAPLDGGKAGKGWKDNFLKQVLMAYGAVVGMNLVLMLLPYFNEIDFFNIAIADYLAQTLIIIVGLITIKAVISTLSGIIGAEDANKAGDTIKKEVGNTIGTATKMTLGAAKIGKKAFDTLPLPQNMMTSYLGAKLQSSRVGQWAGRQTTRAKDAILGRMTDTGRVDENGNPIMERQGGFVGAIKDRQWTKQAIIRDSLQTEAANARTRRFTRMGELGNLGRESVRDNIINQQQARVDQINMERMSATGARARRLERQYNRENARLLDMRGSDGHGANSAYFENERNRLTRQMNRARNSETANNRGANMAQRRFDTINADTDKNGGIAKQSFALAGQLTKSDAGIAEWKEASGIGKKPDNAKDTADNTKAAAESAAVQRVMQEWQLTHPGATPTPQQLEVLRQGKMPRF